MASYQQIRSDFDLKIVRQCAKICGTMSLMSEEDAYRELKAVRDRIEREILIPLESVLDAKPASKEGRAFRQSVDELITYISNKMSLVDPDNISTEDLELGINKTEIQKATIAWGWLDSMPGAWPGA